jgi:glutamine synthetase
MQIDAIKTIGIHINAIKSNIDKMNSELAKAHKLDAEKQAEAFANKIKPLMDLIRDSADALELIVDDEMWPLPKMREILFTR